MKIFSSLFVACFGFCLLAQATLTQTALLATDWPVFHGPKGDNISTETGLLNSWPKDGPTLLWQAKDIGNTEFPGYSSVTIADGIAYTTGNVKQNDNDKAVNSVVFALDTKTGKELWKYDNGPGWTGHYPGDRSTPTVDDGRVYAFSSRGMLVCLDAKTGKEFWKRDLIKEYEATLPVWAYAESPVVDGDKLVCWPGGKKASVVALNKKTGETLWETPGFDSVSGYATMAVFEHGGLRAYANMNQHGLLIVRADNGKRLLFYEHKTAYDVNATMPYYKDGKILISSGYGSGTELLELSVDGDKASIKQIWQEKKLDNQHGGLIVHNGYIYGSSHHYKRGVWLCLKWEDGSIAWENRGVGQGGVAFADGMLYCLGEAEDGKLALVKATPEKYEETGRFNLPEEGAGKFWAHPVVSDKKLYIRHAASIYCFDIAE